MTKYEYKMYKSKRKEEQRQIEEGYKRVATKCKNTKAAFSNDIRLDNLRSDRLERLQMNTGKRACFYGKVRHQPNL